MYDSIFFFFLTAQEKEKRKKKKEICQESMVDLIKCSQQVRKMQNRGLRKKHQEGADFLRSPPILLNLFIAGGAAAT